jgi:hypothetical protein
MGTTMTVFRGIFAAVVSLVLLTTAFSIRAADVSSLNLNVNAECQNGIALFQIVNKGDRWPDSAMLNIYRAVDRTLINRRRLRMAKDQQASFRVSKGTRPDDQLAIYIEPNWYKREFRFDGLVSCR